jgi:DNA-directed RNA polymerase subunit beta'
MAAQSIGEPGTQLTMRTFHTGGVAGDDITHGLPASSSSSRPAPPRARPFSARCRARCGSSTTKRVGASSSPPPKARSSIRSPVSPSSGSPMAPRSRPAPAHRGSSRPQGGPRDRGVRAAQQYLVDQVQEVYKSQGVEIHDKHIEMIVRQMLRRVLIVSPNDSDFLPAALIDEQTFKDVNRELVAAGKQPAEGRPQLMGITKASLATDSWLSAASFQETTRCSPTRRSSRRSDFMRGLKENVIIGKLIPAGRQHRSPAVSGAPAFDCPVPPRWPASEASSPRGSGRATTTTLPEDPAEWLASLGNSAADEEE